MNKPLTMKGNLGKSILQIGAQFGDPPSAVWEYVINSLEYRDQPDGCRIFITTSSKDIVISDNSSGMDENILKNFFTLSGENAARKGKQSSWLKRGMYGTGKLAVFGIANELIVETNHNGIKNSYKLTRKAIENAPEDANEIPIESIKVNEKTEDSNGTVIIINDLNIKVRPNDLIRKIEREISYMRGYDIQIAVNSHVCEFKELDLINSYTYQSDGPIRNRYGDFELKIDVSRVPLDSMDKGIKISCNKNVIGLEDCGVTKKECGNLLTGSVEIPDLEKPINNVESINQTRNLKLNPQHEGVRELLLFIAPKLEKVRKDVLDKKNEERNTLQSKKLTTLTDEITKKLNKQWNETLKVLNDIRLGSNARNALSIFNEPGNDNEIDSLIEGKGVLVGEEEKIRFGEESENPKQPIKESQKILEESENTSREASKNPGKSSKRRRAGFIVVHENLGKDEHRSIYVKDEIKIIINLDHPTVTSCLRSCSGDVENATFKRLIFEISMREFEHAIGQEMISDNDMYVPSDLLFEMRSHFDRITRAIGSDLYL